jgi:hypothetical protein
VEDFQITNSLSTMKCTENSTPEVFICLCFFAEGKLSLLVCGATHTAYFLLAALAAAFLHTPTPSRLLLLVMVVSNAVAEVQYGCSLDFASMTIFIAITVAGE